MFIVKIPSINGLGKTKGCEKAGNEIIRELGNLHSNEAGIPIDVSLLDIEEIHVDNSDISLSSQLIYKNSLKIFETKPKVVFIGGDHSVSYNTAGAFLDYYKSEKKEPCLIVFDAHADCMSPMKEPTHEEWLRALVEKGFSPENILIVGARNVEKSELSFIKSKGIRMAPLNMMEENIEEFCNTIMEFSSGKELYVSLDIDVVDPAFAPGTGYREAGGMIPRQLLYMISRINKIKTLRALDIVEVNSDKDKENMTTKLAAKILSEFM